MLKTTRTIYATNEINDHNFLAFMFFHKYSVFRSKLECAYVFYEFSLKICSNYAYFRACL